MFGTSLFARVSSFAVCALLLSPTNAEAETITYNLENVGLVPDISHPSSQTPQLLTGSFTWTYVPGQFDKGTGAFQNIYVPWYGTHVQGLTFTFDDKSIEITLTNSVHDKGVDVTLAFVAPMSPDQPWVVDLVKSKFQIENGITYKGHMVSGSVVPEDSFQLSVSGCLSPVTQFSIDGATPGGAVPFLYAFGPGSFVIPVGLPCQSTTIGLDGSMTLAAMLIADTGGSISFAASVPPSLCGTLYLQALDLGSCAVSDVVPLL